MLYTDVKNVFPIIIRKLLAHFPGTEVQKNARLLYFLIRVQMYY